MLIEGHGGVMGISASWLSHDSVSTSRPLLLLGLGEIRSAYRKRICEAVQMYVKRGSIIVKEKHAFIDLVTLI